MKSSWGIAGALWQGNTCGRIWQGRICRHGSMALCCIWRGREENVTVAVRGTDSGISCHYQVNFHQPVEKVKSGQPFPLKEPTSLFINMIMSFVHNHDHDRDFWFLFIPDNFSLWASMSCSSYLKLPFLRMVFRLKIFLIIWNMNIITKSKSPRSSSHHQKHHHWSS